MKFALFAWLSLLMLAPFVSGRAESNVPLPIGFSDASFRKLLDGICSTDLSPFAVLVVFGSRTHHSYSYKALPESDLDLALISSDNLAESTHYDAMAALEVQLAPLGAELGFDIHLDFPIIGDLASQLGKDGVFAKGWTPQVERKKYQDLERRLSVISDAILRRHDFKKAVLKEFRSRDRGMFTYQALLVLLNEVGRSQSGTLKAAGFTRQIDLRCK